MSGASDDSSMKLRQRRRTCRATERIDKCGRNRSLHHTYVKGALMKVTMIRSASAALLAVLASTALAAGPAMRTESTTTTMGAGARTAPTTTQPTTTTTTTRGPTSTGQPSQECGSATAPSTPGN